MRGPYYSSIVRGLRDDVVEHAVDAAPNAASNFRLMISAQWRTAQPELGASRFARQAGCLLRRHSLPTRARENNGYDAVRNTRVSIVGAESLSVVAPASILAEGGQRRSGTFPEFVVRAAVGYECRHPLVAVNDHSEIALSDARLVPEFGLDIIGAAIGITMNGTCSASTCSR
jgi:hypothetical protein